MAGPGPLGELKELLYRLYLEAGAPKLEHIAALIAADDSLPGAPEKDTINRCLGSPDLPANQLDVAAIATVLAREARWDPHDTVTRARSLWVQARMNVPAGRPLGEFTDPFALEVHRPIEVAAQPGVPKLPVLPAYILREHDKSLTELVARASAGDSLISVLIGGSSTGKTRACWEAVQTLPAGWRLWHPIFPDRAEAFLAELRQVGPRTVVWLNEAQHYLLTRDPAMGEQVAAGLRDLLRDSARAPVLVLGTIWPQYWQSLTSAPQSDETDPHSHARALLTGAGIEVPDRFTGTALTALVAASAKDLRLAEASVRAEDGQITQYLAGVPVLLERYRAAPPGAKALIHAAMDARRLGYGPALAHGFLEVAVPGYLTDLEWEQAGDDWLERGLAYTAAPCNGIRGALARIRPRPVPSSRTQTSGQTESFAQQAIEPQAQPQYRLADYLEQTGRRSRADKIPPATFWDAIISHADPQTLTSLGYEARDQRLYRLAARLWMQAASGAASAGRILIRHLREYSPDAVRQGIEWISIHANITNATGAIWLFLELREAGAADAVTTLAMRAALDVDIGQLKSDRPIALLMLMWEAGENEAAQILAARVVETVPLKSPFGVGWLLDHLQRTGADAVAATLARRAAETFPLDNLFAVAGLLGVLRAAGADDAARALLARNPARIAPLDNPSGIAILLGELRAAGAHEAVTTLVVRIVETVPLDEASAMPWLLEKLDYVGILEQNSPNMSPYDPHVSITQTAPSFPAASDRGVRVPFGIANLLKELREAGADEAVATLAAYIARTTPLDDPMRIAWRLGDLREAGAADAVATLAERAAQADPLHDLRGLGSLLMQLREAGAADAVTTLAMRAALDVDIGQLKSDRPIALLMLMWEAGENEAAQILAARVVETVPLKSPFGVGWLLDHLQRTGADAVAATLARRAAETFPLDNLFAVAGLLGVLRAAGADDAARALLARNPARIAPLDNPSGIAILLGELRAAGAHEAVTTLVVRIVETVPLDEASAMPWLLEKLDYVGILEQNSPNLSLTSISITTLSDRGVRVPFGIANLLKELREAGADEAVATLAAYIARTTPLDDPMRIAWRLGDLREAGAADAVATLAERAAHVVHVVPLHDLRGLGSLLMQLREAGAADAVTMLAERAAHGAPIDDLSKASVLLEELKMAGARAAANTLEARLVEVSHLVDLSERQIESFPYGREPDGRPSAPWGWTDLT